MHPVCLPLGLCSCYEKIRVYTYLVYVCAWARPQAHTHHLRAMYNAQSQEYQDE